MLAGSSVGSSVDRARVLRAFQDAKQVPVLFRRRCLDDATIAGIFPQWFPEWLDSLDPALAEDAASVRRCLEALPVAQFEAGCRDLVRSREFVDPGRIRRLTALGGRFSGRLLAALCAAGIHEAVQGALEWRLEFALPRLALRRPQFQYLSQIAPLQDGIERFRRRLRSRPTRQPQKQGKKQCSAGWSKHRGIDYRRFCDRRAERPTSRESRWIASRDGPRSLAADRTDRARRIRRRPPRRRPELIAELDFTPRRKQLAGTLSGGWKQRLSPACAIAHRPDVLFLDEPTAGVDPAARRQFWEVIRELARNGTTILVTTHYMDEAERCERLAMLWRGRLVAVGEPHEITQQLGQPTLEDAFIALQEQEVEPAA